MNCKNEDACYYRMDYDLLCTEKLKSIINNQQQDVTNFHYVKITSETHIKTKK